MDLGQPHFRLTVNGTALDWREAWTATAAGESDLNVGAMDQPTGDRDGFGFLLPAAVGTYDCTDVRATYSRIRDNSSSVTAWPTLGNEGAECAVEQLRRLLRRFSCRRITGARHRPARPRRA